MSEATQQAAAPIEAPTLQELEPHLAPVLVGALLFRWLDPRLVAGIVGVFTLLFLAQRLLFPPKPGSAPPPR